ncbi:Deuterolysin metalloprotease family-domain-containing protein [Aspergillus spinulosporus]
MVFVPFFYLLAGLTLAAGKPILLPRLAQEASQDVAEHSFDVTLESLGNSTVKAEITNTGTEGLRLVQRGGILDQFPTRKVNVKGGDSDPKFTGVRVEYILSHLTADGFVQLSPNQTVGSVFDIADLYELSPGQEYTAVAKGLLQYTTLANKKKFLTFSYKSNNISFTAPTDTASRLEDRSTLVCSDEYNQIVQDAISRAAEMATAAAADARTGSALFQKYFKSTSEDDIEEVAGRLDAIAKEATTTGQLKYYCEPTSEDYCAGNVAAMTYPTLNRVVNCPGYYSSTKVSNYCGYLDQAAITLHEYAHADALYSPGTEDIAYGYESVLSLDTEDSKNNADNFAYYASSVFLQCDADEEPGEIGSELDVDVGSGGSDSTQTPTATAEPTNTPAPTSTGTTGTGTGTGTGIGTGTGTGTGWTWPWGQGWGMNDGSSSGDSGSFTGTTSDTDTSSGTGYSTDFGTGTGTGVYGGWDAGKSSGSSVTAVTSTPTTAPVTTTNGQELWNLNDLVNWLVSMYAGDGQTQGQTQTKTVSSNLNSGSGGYNAEAGQSATGTQAAQAENEEDCDE